jgi:hypothetical protein
LRALRLGNSALGPDWLDWRSNFLVDRDLLRETGIHFSWSCVKGKSETSRRSKQGSKMPNYTFELRDGSDPVEDDVGVILTDRQDAYQYARGVVRELMSGREAQTRTWRLDVYENSEECVFAIPFASPDETLAHLQPELRALVEGLCERDRRLHEATQSALRESRARLARSLGKPYLITNLGKPTITGS